MTAIRPRNFAHGARTEADFATAPRPIIDSVDDTLAFPNRAAGVRGALERVDVGLEGLRKVRELAQSFEVCTVSRHNLT